MLGVNFFLKGVFVQYLLALTKNLIDWLILFETFKVRFDVYVLLSGSLFGFTWVGPIFIIDINDSGIGVILQIPQLILRGQSHYLIAEA